MKRPLFSYQRRRGIDPLVLLMFTLMLSACDQSGGKSMSVRLILPSLRPLPQAERITYPAHSPIQLTYKFPRIGGFGICTGSIFCPPTQE